jgi:Glycosyltransferase 61
MQRPTLDSSETPLAQFRKRQVGGFDRLENEGDYKILMPMHRAIIPDVRILESSGQMLDRREASFEYTFPEVAITKIHDAIVSRTGAVFKDGIAISDTIEGLLPQSLEDVIAHDTLEELEEITSTSRFGGFNHAVFTCEVLPLIYLGAIDLQASGTPNTMFFDNRFCSQEYRDDHNKFISQLGLASTAKRITRPVFARQVWIPTVSRRHGASRASLLSPFMAQLALAIVPTNGEKATPSRIYISRRFANARVPTNIDELEAVAEQRGFVPVYLEKMSIIEQIRIFHAADMVLAEHGAGLINLLYCRPNVKVLEMFPSKMWGHWTFRLVSYVAGLKYAAGVFDVGSAEWQFNLDPVSIDIAMFRSGIEFLEAETPP